MKAVLVSRQYSGVTAVLVSNPSSGVKAVLVSRLGCLLV